MSDREGRGERVRCAWRVSKQKTQCAGVAIALFRPSEVSGVACCGDRCVETAQ